MEKQNQTKKSLQAEQTRRIIREKAMDCFQRMDYDAVTIRKICKESGVSVGTFYHYYKSKEEIFLDLHRQQADHLKEFFSNLDEGLTVSEKVLALACCYAADVEAAGVEVSQILYNPRSSVPRNQQPLEDLYTQVLKNAGIADSQEVVMYLLIATQGVVYDWCKGGGNYSLQKMMDSYMRRNWISKIGD